MSDYLSSNEGQPCQPGSIVVNVGQGQWKTLANASTAYGCLIGMNVKLTIPGNAIQVITQGRFPYDAYNLGAGNAQTVVIGNVPSRGPGNPAGGVQVIGTCGPDGEITLSRSYLGEPANGVVENFAGYALSGTALATGQAWVLDVTGKLTPANVVSGSGGFPSGTGIIHVTGGTVNSPAYIGSADQLLTTNHTATDTAWVSINGGAGQDASYANGAWTNLAIHGASVPAAGSLTTGNLLQVSGASSLTYGPLNLAGGSASVTGNLPTSNFAPGTAGQVLMTNGVPAVTWASLSQDATLSNSGAVTVGGLLAHALPALSVGYLNWSGSAWNFTTVASIFTAGGDLSGTATSQEVVGLLSHALPSLTVGYLNWSGSTWQLSTPTSFTPGGDLTGNATQQYVQSLSGASGSGATVTIASNVTSLQPGDNVTALGSASHRLLSSNAGPTGFNVYNSSGAALPVTALSSNGLTFSVGSGSNDVKLQRGGVALAVLDNAAGGNATLEVGGGSTALSLASSNRTISVTGTGPNSGTAASLAFTAQSPGATNGTPGSIFMALAAPTGSGNDGSVQVQRGGTRVFEVFPVSNTGVELYGAGSQYFLYSDSNSTTHINSGGTFTAFEIGGSAVVNLTATILEPASAGTTSNGSAANYWNGTYSSAFVFPAGLGANGTLGWSAAAASGAGFDTRVSAQNAMLSGTFNGGSVWMMSGGVNSGSGNPGNVIASIGSNTSHVWTPTGTSGTFQVIDGNGLQAVIGDLNAASGGSATLSALWLGAGSNAFTPSSTNYIAKCDGGNLSLNAPTSGDSIALQVAGTTYASLFNFAFSPASAGGINLGQSTVPFGVSYLGGNSTGSFGFLQPTGTHNSQTNTVLRQIADFHTSTSTNGQVAWTYTTASDLMYYLEVRWVSKDPSKNTAAGGRSTAVYENQAGTLAQLGTNTDVVIPASNNSITLSISSGNIAVEVNPSAGSGTDATDWQFEITLMTN